MKTDLPAQLTALSPSSSPPKKIPTSPVVSATAASDSSVTSRPELAQPVESLPFDLDNFHISPRANLAVPSLNTPLEDDGGYDIYEALEPNAEPDSSAVTLAEPHSAQAASAVGEFEQSPAESSGASGLGDLAVDRVNTVAGIVSDSEDDDEDLLSTLFYNEDPAELCR